MCICVHKASSLWVLCEGQRALQSPLYSGASQSLHSEAAPKSVGKRLKYVYVCMYLCTNPLGALQSLLSIGASQSPNSKAPSTEASQSLHSEACSYFLLILHAHTYLCI